MPLGGIIILTAHSNPVTSDQPVPSIRPLSDILRIGYHTTRCISVGIPARWDAPSRGVEAYAPGQRRVDRQGLQADEPSCEPPDETPRAAGRDAAGFVVVCFAGGKPGHPVQLGFSDLLSWLNGWVPS